jgi:hypothetical protein
MGKFEHKFCLQGEMVNTLINAHLLEYLLMLCIGLTVQPGCLVDLTQLLLGLTKLTLEVLHQLLVTSVLTLGQITLSFSYLLLTTDIPVCVSGEKGRGGGRMGERERSVEDINFASLYRRKILLDNLPQLL